MLSNTVSRLGATPISLSVVELYEALQRGTVDGTAIHYMTFPTFKFDEVTSYHIDFPLSSWPIILAMPKKRYDALSPAARKVLVDNGGEEQSALWGDFYDRLDQTSRAAVEAKKGRHTIVVPTKAEADAWRAKISPVLDDWAKSVKGGEQVLRAYRAEIEKATNELRRARRSPMTVVDADATDQSFLDLLVGWCVRLTNPLAFLGVVGMLVVSGLTMYDIIARWAFSSGIPALNEITGLTFSVAVTACIPAGVAQAVNLKVDLFESALRGKWKEWLTFLGDLLLLLTVVGNNVESFQVRSRIGCSKSKLRHSGVADGPFFLHRGWLICFRGVGSVSDCDQFFLARNESRAGPNRPRFG